MLRGVILLIAILLSRVSVSLADNRHWTDKTGRFSVHAELVEKDDVSVTLKTADGRRVEVPIANLSDADRRFVTAFATEPEPTPAAGPRLANPKVLAARLGVEVVAQNGPCKNITCGFPIPLDWPEQKVTIVAREVSANARNVKVRTLGDGVRQVQFVVPRLRQGESASVAFQLEIQRQAIAQPPDTSVFLIPKSPGRKLRPFLGESPMIETKHAMLRREAEKLQLDETLSAWDQVQAIRDYTHAKVEYTGVKALKGALRGLTEGTGDCEERTSVFVALCRLNRIPARSIWIPRHAYAEFYLEDATGKGYWFPCGSVTQEFGEKDNTFLIIQKGDNFRDPLRPGPQRYISESAKGFLNTPTLKPIHDYPTEKRVE